MYTTYTELIQYRIDIEKAVMEKYKVQDMKKHHVIKYIITLLKGGD